LSYLWFIWTHGYLLFSLIYNSLLHLVILVVKLSEIWLLGAPSTWLLCPCYMHCLF
jgi:hypothetical protein